jgi:chemotaxis protein MotD
MPAASPSPMQQVAGRIAAAAHAMPSDASRPSDTVPARLASSPVVKVLRLELQPADLGTITIRMSLKQDGLDVRVEAGRVETARMLQSDQEALSKILSNAGYRIEHMSVAAASFDGSAGADGSRGQAFLPASGSQQGWSQEADARSSGGRQHAEPDRRTFRGRQNDETEKNGAVPSAGGHLYV